MMPELSLNILDVAENSVRAGATLIEIEIAADTKQDTLRIAIRDNGCGMSKEQMDRVSDPFYTTRTTRKVGLGVPFFRQAAESSGGYFRMESEEDVGTSVEAVFGLSHIDRMPLGDINATIHTLIVFHEPIEFWYRYAFDEKEFVLDTREVRKMLGEISLKEAEVSQFLKDYLDTNKMEVDNGNVI